MCCELRNDKLAKKDLAGGTGSDTRVYLGFMHDLRLRTAEWHMCLSVGVQWQCWLYYW